MIGIGIGIAKSMFSGSAIISSWLWGAANTWLFNDTNTWTWGS
jgi:hypothetical protein